MKTHLAYLEDEKKKKESSGRGQKHKLLNDEIDELQNKKRCLQTDIDSLTTSADEYAEKAEQTHQVSWITKANSFRRSAKEKRAEVTVVEEQLKQKLQELLWNVFKCVLAFIIWFYHLNFGSNGYYM